MGFPGGTVVKNPPVKAGDTGDVGRLEKISWRKKWQPTQVFLRIPSTEEPGMLHSIGLQ